MAMARQNEIQERLDKIEKELELEMLRESRPVAAVTLPIILTVIVVAGAGSLYTLSEMISDSNAHFRMRIDDTNTQLSKRIDDTNDRIRTVKSDLEKDIANIDAKLDRLLLR